MQTKALQANVLAGRVTEGCAVGEAWMEWLMKQSYDRVAALDADHTDTAQLRLPCPATAQPLSAVFRRGVWNIY